MTLRIRPGLESHGSPAKGYFYVNELVTQRLGQQFRNQLSVTNSYHVLLLLVIESFLTLRYRIARFLSPFNSLGNESMTLWFLIVVSGPS